MTIIICYIHDVCSTSGCAYGLLCILPCTFFPEVQHTQSVDQTCRSSYMYTYAWEKNRSLEMAIYLKECACMRYSL